MPVISGMVIHVKEARSVEIFNTESLPLFTSLQPTLEFSQVHYLFNTLYLTFKKCLLLTMTPVAVKSAAVSILFLALVPALAKTVT